MQDDPQSWLLPLAFLPGIGLLIMSTSARYLGVSADMQKLVNEPPQDAVLPDLLISRASCLQQALLVLYAAATMFAMATVSSALLDMYPKLATIITGSLLILGVSFLMYAAGHLCWEIISSRRILHHQRKIICKRTSANS